ncbi:MAG: LemA family protein [bacterium]
MMALMILLAVIGLVVVGFIAIYNRLVRNRNMVREGWSGIDVQLKRRADLIPNLIETVKGYMIHERELLTRVTELRSRSMRAQDIAERTRAEGELSRTLANLFAVAENYPALKANENFLELQRQIADLEEQIQFSRRYYNGTVRNYNTMIESFPSNIVARMFNFTQADYFEIGEEADRAVPRVRF